MALGVNRELGITGQRNIYAPAPSDIVKGDELNRLAREILTGAPRKAAVNTNQADLKIFSPGAEVNTAKQVATNRTGYNVVLSRDALQAINSLKAQAAQVHAQNQVQNLTRAVDGKIHINSEKVDFSETKSVFTANSYHELEISESSNLAKDRKGPGGLFVPFEKDEEDNNEGLNLTI